MFKKATNMLIFKKSKRYVHPIPDRVCSTSEIILDRTSVYTQERFSGAISIRSDLSSWRVIY